MEHIDLENSPARVLSPSEYYHYRQAWIPLRWLPSESVFEDDFSTKSDVWAFGVLMWEVFSHGELPHAKLSDDETLEGQCDTSDTVFFFGGWLGFLFRDAPIPIPESVLIPRLSTLLVLVKYVPKPPLRYQLYMYV